MALVIMGQKYKGWPSAAPLRGGDALKHGGRDMGTNEGNKGTTSSGWEMRWQRGPLPVK